MKFRVIKTHLGIFDISVAVVVTEDRKQLRQYLRKTFRDKNYQIDPLDLERAPRGEYYFKNGFIPVLWIPRPPKTPREYATLAHESLHATRRMILEWAGIPFTSETDEVYTHTMSWIITNTLEQLKK